MKILLISIDLVLGTRVLVNVLKKRGFEAHNLQIVNIRYSDTLSEKTLRNIYDFSKGYDVVGLSFNSFYSVLAARLAKYLKSRGIRWVICGGPHPTAAPEEIMEHSDIAVVYEAEITLPRLLDNLKRDVPPDNIKGLVFKGRNGRIINTGCPEIETDLDSIPLQNFSPEDITYYDFEKSNFVKPAVHNLFSYGGRNYFIMTSRGCPFKCAYCCNNLFAKLNEKFARIRKRSVRNIISEMKAAKIAGFNGFYIADDNFLSFSLSELESFSRIYRSQINLPFGISGLNPNNMRSKNSAEKIGLLLCCGLSDIRIGAQSGNDKTLKKFKRRYTALELPKLLNIFENRHTIWKKPDDKLRVAVDFICDAPWENANDKLKTLKLANNLLSTYSVFFYTLIYLPGTEIYETALKKGWFKDKEQDIYLRGIAGVEDNIYNRIFFLIAVLHERGIKLPDIMIDHILKIHKDNPSSSENLIDFIIGTVNSVEDHHGFKNEHLTLHPYLKGFNKWEKTVGRKGKKVLFRSYHMPYG